ncbi:MAG TPA: cytochrome c oxidase subunit 3 [Saprospiraceae bacterium]|nr:cytochrome c oxidase subunit 3 [Saprospiraceae bacterium]HNA41048.1 cytochrome c oxidase subunit 3 [Saprospiraceae bacterium]HNJ64084.1 cytochrome c oxidase subunit 3 [Saprospiraceae bacterium]
MNKYKQDRYIITDSDRNLTFHPYRILLVLFIVGMTMLFLSLTAAYIYNRIVAPSMPPIKVPALFVFNTIVLLGSSLSLMRAKQSYRKDDTEAYKYNLLITIGLTVIFLLLQILAWKSLFEANISITHNNLASYLYMLSALHFLHVIGGLPFMLNFYFNALKNMKEPVSVLIYFSDPFKKLKLNILSLYWHFLDILWIYLVLFLWVNQLIK